ncbi:MAG: sugar ABC transporter substrate-binding protein [Chloroflexota bacterium]|jgi:ribose transport system substrate-binding protein
MNKTVLRLLSVVLIVASMASWMTVSAQDSVSVAVSLGWQENESGQRFTQGYKAAFEELGWESKFANANYDPKLQSEQIDAFVKDGPDALFVTCSDPVGITQAVNRAIDAGIPVFLADCYIAGVAATTSIASNNYGMGMYTMEYIAQQIGGKGKVGMIGLPNNETWDLRELGARYVLQNYPEIEIDYWAYDSTGAVTPRQAIENMLTANPPGTLDAIWCSWDGAAMEGDLAAREAGRANEIIFTGIDGGERAFEQIQSGGAFKLTMAQSIYWMSYMGVKYAQDYLNGAKVPRFVVAPVYAVDKETLDAVPSGVNAVDYDIPGMEVQLGWMPVK